MSNTQLFSMMAIAEIIMIMIVLAIIIFRIKSSKIKSLQKDIEKIHTKHERSSKRNSSSYDNLLQKQIAETQSFLSVAESDQQYPLNKRVEFLDSEKQFFDSQQKNESDYWQSLCSRINLIAPNTEKSVEPISEVQAIDDTEDILDSFEALPIETSELSPELEEQTNLDAVIAADLSKAMEELAPHETDFTKNDSTDTEETEKDEEEIGASHKSTEIDLAEDGNESGSESTKELDETSQPESNQEITEDIDESANELSVELSDLQHSLVKKDSELESLKSSLADKDQELNQFDDLTKKLQQTELAHEELNACIENLEKDNEDLQTQLKITTDSAKDEEDAEEHAQFEQIEKLNHALDSAQINIDSLHQDLDEKDKLINNIEQEVETLQSDLRDRSQERDQLQETTNELMSELGIITDSADPEILTSQIEDLTNLVVTKSEKLSSLQPEESLEDEEEFDFDFSVDNTHHADDIPELNDIEIPTMNLETPILPPEISQDMRDLLDSQRLNDDVESEIDNTPPILTNGASE